MSEKRDPPGGDEGMDGRTLTSGGCGLRNYNLGNDMAARHTIHDTGMAGQIGAYNEWCRVGGTHHGRALA
jgi:hypothetical protein